MKKVMDLLLLAALLSCGTEAAAARPYFQSLAEDLFARRKQLSEFLRNVV